MEIVETRSMHALPQIALAFTAFGQSQAASGKLEDAMTTLDHGLALRRNLPGLSPWPTMHHLLVMGRVAVMAGDPPLGRQLLNEAAAMIRRYPQGMTAMIARLDTARKSLRESRNGELRSERLTAREIDILRKLATPQSVPLAEHREDAHPVAVSQTRGTVSLRGGHDWSPAAADLGISPG